MNRVSIILFIVAGIAFCIGLLCEGPLYITTLIVATIASTIAHFLHRFCQSRKRRKELSQWAMRRGISFSADQDFSICSRYASFKSVNLRSRAAHNVMAGTAQGRSICAFDIIGQNAIKERPRNDDSLSFFFENISVVLVTSDIPLKPLLIQRHKPSKKSDGVFGFHNIELELAEFNREFHVSAPDRRWAFDVLTQPVMEFLLASPRFCLEFDDCHVIAYRGGAFTTEDFEAALAVIAGVLDRIPRCVVE